MKSLILLLAVAALFPLLHSARLSQEESSAADYLKTLNKEAAHYVNLGNIASWNYATNITPENALIKKSVEAKTAKFMKGAGNIKKKFTSWPNYTSSDIKRQFKLFSVLGYAALSEEDYRQYMDITDIIKTNFAKVRVCAYENSTKCDLHLEPDVEEIFAKSRDAEELKHYWRAFYDKAGTPVRKPFEQYIQLNTKAAQLNGFRNGAESWLDQYEDASFEKQLEDIFKTLQPLYLQLHAYVRKKLSLHYGTKIVSETGPIPMHLLGNMWAQTWSNIADIVAPFPNATVIDVTNDMIRQRYTPVKMIQKADEFFQSLGFAKLPNSFWKKSLFEKPKDGRVVVCHARAWDFYVVDDVRISMCTRVNEDHFLTAHHELGHIQYFLQYEHQPFVYRSGANPGFHEAVGDVLSLSVVTPRHLQRIGLLKNYTQNKEARINFLFSMALDKIAFLPFAYTMDKYRWALFRGQLDKNNWNCGFWKLREEYSGIEPPVERSEKDFDPPAKYHISADVEYLRYVVAIILQFQFYKAACIKAGQYDPKDPSLPLDNCDIYGSPKVGEALKKMLQMGASKPWPDAMEALTGERKLSAQAIADYFEPLRIWLEAENKKNKIHIGWKASNKCKSSKPPADIKMNDELNDPVQEESGEDATEAYYFFLNMGIIPIT